MENQRMTVTVEEAATILGVARNKAYEAARSGEIPTIRIGKRILEVTARLKSVDDLELLVKVLEANKAALAKADREASEVLNLTEELADVASSKPNGKALALVAS